MRSRIGDGDALDAANIVNIGIFAPAGTSRDVVAKLHGDIAATLARADIREQLESQGANVVASTPDELGAFVRKESVPQNDISAHVERHTICSIFISLQINHPAA